MRVAKVFPPKKLNSGKLLGFVDILFALSDGGDGCMTIRGWKIFKGDNGRIQVGPPATKNGNDYFPVMNFNFEKEDAKALMNHITEEVAKTYNNSDSSEPTSKKGVSSDDVPF